MDLPKGGIGYPGYSGYLTLIYDYLHTRRGATLFISLLKSIVASYLVLVAKRYISSTALCFVLNILPSGWSWDGHWSWDATERECTANFFDSTSSILSMNCDF